MRIATIGTGVIVEAFIESANMVEGVKVIGSYSRTLRKAQEFSDKFAMDYAFDNLKSMFDNKKIDTIYIASPNSLHYEQAVQAIHAGKNVIVEKPFTGTLEAAKEISDLAIEKGVYVFEAICNIHMPHFDYIFNKINSLGNIKLVQANYSQYSSRYDELRAGRVTNVFNPEFSGGALADINIYNLHFAVKLFGKPQDLHYFANQHENGIDTSGILILKYDSFIVELAGAKDSASYNFVLIQGDEGTIHVPNGSNALEKVIVTRKDEEIEYNNQEKPRLYYQVEKFQEIIESKNYDTMIENLNHSLLVVELAEKAQKMIGLKFKQ